MISFSSAKSGDICGALCNKLTLCGAGVGMNNTKILAAIKNYNDNNKGGILISNAFYSGSLTGFSFTTSINGAIYDNGFSYEVLQTQRD